MHFLWVLTFVLIVPIQAAEPQYKDRQYQSVKRSVGDRPNIILITLDHMRVDNIAANGYPHMVTPHMDKLVKGGQSFVRHQIAANACMPSRASLFSGRFPQNHGVLTNGVPMPEDEICIQHVLRDNGYFTGQIGKLHFWPHKERDHRGPHPAYAFDEMLLSDEPGSYDDAYGKWLEAKGPEAREAGDLGLPLYRKHVAKVFPGKAEWTQAGFVGDQSIRFIQRNAGRPFFLHAGFYAPHPPLNPPERDYNQYSGKTFPPLVLESEEQLKRLPESYQHANAQDEDFDPDYWQHYRQCFYGMVTDADLWIGAMVEALKKQGIFENTLIVITSDHGDHLGDHGQNSKNSYPYKTVYTVPLVMVGPGIPARGVVDNLASAVDVMPTLLEAADAPTPRSVNGISLWPLLKEGNSVREYTYSETNTMRMIQTDQFKYAYHKDGSEVLFDLQKDPNELNNLSLNASHKQQLEDMRYSMLMKLWTIGDDKLQRITDW
jgi:arylsulfatase A-like enzyme